MTDPSAVRTAFVRVETYHETDLSKPDRYPHPRTPGLRSKKKRLVKKYMRKPHWCERCKCYHHVPDWQPMWKKMRNLYSGFADAIRADEDAAMLAYLEETVTKIMGETK